MANHDVRYPDLQYQRLEELDMDTVEEMYQRLLVDAQSIDDEAISDTTYEQAARKLAELYRHKEWCAVSVGRQIKPYRVNEPAQWQSNYSAR